MFTSITERVLAGIVCVCAALSISLGVALRVEHASLKVAQTQLAKAKADVEAARKERDANLAALNTLRGQLAVIAESEAKAKGKLNEALSTNGSWSDAPVPDSVFNAIFEPSAGSAAR